MLQQSINPRLFMKNRAVPPKNAAVGKSWLTWRQTVSNSSTGSVPIDTNDGRHPQAASQDDIFRQGLLGVLRRSSTASAPLEIARIDDPHRQKDQAAEFTRSEPKALSMVWTPSPL